MISTELYDVLGVKPNAATSTIKAAFRKLAKTHHPDVGGDAEAFNQITIAYKVLSDREKRKAYDETGQIDMAVIVDEREETLKVLVGVFEGHMQAGFVRAKDRSVVPAMRDVIKDQLRKFDDQELACKAEIEALADFRDSITTKDADTVNVFANVLNDRINAQNTELVTIADAKKYGKLALEELSNYDSFARMVQQFTFAAPMDTSTVRQQIFQLDVT